MKSETLALIPADPQANWEKETEKEWPPSWPLEKGRVARVDNKELAGCLLFPVPCAGYSSWELAHGLLI